MREVSYAIDIGAPAEEVFDLICRVEEFPRYSTYIKEVVRTAPRLYRWRVKVLGVELGWEAEVTELDRPGRFAWQSVTGLYNTGSYTLRPAPGGGGTRVYFRMEYRLAHPVLEKLASAGLEHFMREVYEEFLAGVKRKLEG